MQKTIPKRKLDYEQMFKSTIERDKEFDGLFYVGVLSTKIYCLPSCKARKPLKKNIIFFEKRKDAIFKGFRGCKRCRAEYFPDESPFWFDSVCTLLKNEIERKLTEKDLAQVASVNISTIRRYFKIRFQLTPLAFHRKLRLQYARKLIETGEKYRNVSSRCGFRSSSGFRKAFTKEFGLSPGQVQRVQ